MTTIRRDRPFIRLDFDGSLAKIHIERHEAIIATDRKDEVKPCLDRIEKAVQSGCYAIGFLSYEAAAGLDAAMTVHSPYPDLPLLWFMLCRPSQWQRQPDEPMETAAAMSTTQLQEWRPSRDRDSYRQAFERIKRYIRDGASYQINLSFPLQAEFHGDTATLYAQLTRSQSAKYCAWIHSEKWDILSASPELFFRLDGRTITAEPMKGTRPRGRTLYEDQAIAAELAASEKDRAENVMIVDLLRNDLGRIAEIGSVTVPRRFSIERYPTVWQMSSTVQARLKQGLSFIELLTALFPCGSVTGAPKVKTMEIIQEQEQGPRGVYCGTIGYFTPNGQALFNVAIRTLTLFPDAKACYPVGSGLVADSDCDTEYDECLLKARILTHPYPRNFSLLETMRYDPRDGYFLLQRHLQRLERSAQYFGYPYDVTAIHTRLHVEAKQWQLPIRVRLLLDHRGRLAIEHEDLKRSPRERRMTLGIAAKAIDSRNIFLYHKTTYRQVYDTARASDPAMDDVILYNERGEVTESSLANLAIERDGILITPPTRCGLLPGTLRAELLVTKRIREGIIRIDELEQGMRIHLFNSLRGQFIGVLRSLKNIAMESA